MPTGRAQASACAQKKKKGSAVGRDRARRASQPGRLPPGGTQGWRRRRRRGQAPHLAGPCDPKQKACKAAGAQASNRIH
eukprot:4431021-Lingulodinium_polyedra.AAC.1